MLVVVLVVLVLAFGVGVGVGWRALTKRAESIKNAARGLASRGAFITPHYLTHARTHPDSEHIQ